MVQRLTKQNFRVFFRLGWFDIEIDMLYQYEQNDFSFGPEVLSGGEAQVTPTHVVLGLEWAGADKALIVSRLMSQCHSALPCIALQCHTKRGRGFVPFCSYKNFPAHFGDVP